MGMIKGQGATEYLVLLGAVLIVALVALALLGFFPGLSTDAKIQQSQAYWQSEAKPFSIVESKVSASTGEVTLALQNKDATGTFTLNAITLSSGGVTNSTSGLQIPFPPGSTQQVNGSNVPGMSISGAALGGAYDLQVTFNYTSPSQIPNQEYGGKTLTGRYVS